MTKGSQAVRATHVASKYCFCSTNKQHIFSKMNQQICTYFANKIEITLQQEASYVQDVRQVQKSADLTVQPQLYC